MSIGLVQQSRALRRASVALLGAVLFGFGPTSACGGTEDRFAPIPESEGGLPGFDGSLPDVKPRDVEPRCSKAREPYGTDPDFGESLPDILLLDCDGNSVTVDEMRCEHSLTLISIGAGWCEPCQAEAGVMEFLYNRYSNRGLNVVQFMYADAQGYLPGPEFCRVWRDSFSLSYPVYVDPQSNTLQFLSQGVTPVNMLVDERGKVVWFAPGVLPDDFEGILLDLL